MADQHSLPSPTTSIPSLFGSPRFFNGSFRSIFDSETIMSPTSILDTKKVTNLISPFGYDQNMSKSQNTSSQEKGLGLALVDDEENLDNFNFTKPKLKIQIPILPFSVCSPNQSPKSAADFVISTPNRNSQSPFQGRLKSSVEANGSALTLSEMELSEDYTCVISHGPNPKTIRIYDNCVVESSCNGGVVGMTDLKKESPFQNLCPNCKKNLGDGKDRSEGSDECLCHQMVLSDEVKISEMNNGF